MSSAAIKQATNLAKSAILTKLCDMIDIVKETNDGKIPYGFVSKQVNTTKHVFPWRETQATLISPIVPLGIADGIAAVTTGTSSSINRR